MKAIILAAGQSKRLRPITNKKPKCLLKVGNKIIIDHQIETLLKNKVKEIIIVTGFKAKKLENHLKKQHPRANFIFIYNKKYKTTYPAYGLWLAREYLEDNTLYLNADVLFHPLIIKKIINSSYKSVTAIQKVLWDEEEVNVVLKNNSLVVRIGKDINQRESHGEFIGVTKFDKKFNSQLVQALNYYFQRKEFKKFAADAINLTIKKYKGKLYIEDISELPCIEIDTPEDYQKAKLISNLLWEK